jgi:hypothetical protein
VFGGSTPFLSEHSRIRGNSQTRDWMRKVVDKIEQDNVVGDRIARSDGHTGRRIGSSAAERRQSIPTAEGGVLVNCNSR